MGWILKIWDGKWKNLHLKWNCFIFFTKKKIFIFSLKLIYFHHLDIHLACLFVSNKRKNDWTEPLRPQFCVGPHMAPGKVYEWSKFQIFVPIKIRFSFNFLKLWKPTKFFVKIREHFLFCFYDVHKENHVHN